MREIRRKEKSITDKKKMQSILMSSKYITIAMVDGGQPYLATLSHGYDKENNCIYFHCAQEGKKIDIIEKNNLVWGQALLDEGYVQGKCDHLYATTQFRGRVTFISDYEEKKHALTVMVLHLEEDPQAVISEQFDKSSIEIVNIGKIDIEYMSGKKSSEIVI